MSMKYIIFEDRATEAQGLLALARKTRVDALPGAVYRVCDKDLDILRELDLGFRIASNEEARQATEGIRDPVASKV